jgi:hypothetical protein
MSVEPVAEFGYERDSLSARSDVGGSIRWWFFVCVPGRRFRQARRGVIDRGFRFARGGRVETAEQAEQAVRAARDVAEWEIRIWNHQPSHRLGPAGELIPLDVVLPEIEAGR